LDKWTGFEVFFSLNMEEILGEFSFKMRGNLGQFSFEMNKA
jgi:hypothetical protein